MAVNEDGHYGKYSGNARCCAHTRVDAHNYKATERDDAAHIDYIKEMFYMMLTMVMMMKKWWQTKNIYLN